jgi:tetratricopeptide (TPR) repeat protein
MGVVSRWTAAVASSLVCFGGCWTGLAAERVLDTGPRIWTALVLSLLVLTVLGLWARRTRENPAEDARTRRASGEVEDTPQGQAIGQAGDGTPLPGADHPPTFAARTTLARACGGAGRTQDAIALLEGILADRERLFGADHPDTLVSRSNLAKAYLTAGRPAEAIPLLERTFADRGRVLGADHPSTLMSCNVLAGAYLAVGRPAEALPLFERMVADSERLYGVGHPSTNILRMNLAALKGKLDASCVPPGK